MGEILKIINFKKLTITKRKKEIVSFVLQAFIEFSLPHEAFPNFLNQACLVISLMLLVFFFLTSLMSLIYFNMLCIKFVWLS